MCFSELQNPKKIVIPNSIKEIGDGAFSGCENITEILIPKSIIEIEEYAFSGCKGLNEITILCPISLKKIFQGCTSLKSITLGVGIKRFSKDFFDGWSGNLEVINVPANKTEYYKKRIPEHFHGIIKELPAEKKTRKRDNAESI